MEYEVACVSTDDAAPYEDCRRIETIGYLVDGTITKRTPKEIHDMISFGVAEFYVEREGGRTYLEAAERDGTAYVRTHSADTDVDVLLEQPSCE